MSNPNGTAAAAAAVGYGRLASDFAEALKTWDNDPSEGNRQRLEQLRVRINEELAGNAMPASEVDSDKLAAELGDEKRRADTLQTMAEEIDRMLKRPPAPVTDWRTVTAPDREWLIKDWLPAGRIGMLSGTGGAGKSLLGLQMTAALASGEREWLGRAGLDPLLSLATEQTWSIVYAGYEDEPEEIRRRLGWIEARYKGTRGGDLLSALDDRLAYVPMAPFGPIWAVPTGTTRHGRAEITTAGEWLREYCVERKACLLVVDPLAAAYGSDENDNAAAAEFISDWGAWATEADCAVLLVHHLSKTEAATGEGEGYRGATAWQGGMRYFWRLQGDKLEALKTSYARTPVPVYLDRDKEGAKGTWQAASKQKTPEEENAGKCQGKNNRGEPCGNMAVSGGYCKHHQGQANGTAKADDVHALGEEYAGSV